jgi:hypothetical protein
MACKEWGRKLTAQFDSQPFVREYVVALDVPVHDPLRVHERQRLGCLNGHVRFAGAVELERRRFVEHVVE